MELEILSQEWADAWKDALNASPAYRAAAASWEGAVVAAVRAQAERRIGQRALFLDLWHGSCRAARPAADADFATARYVLTASAATWTELLNGALDPVAAVTGGRLELTKGSVLGLFPHLAAAKELVAVARCLGGVPPPEWGAT